MFVEANEFLYKLYKRMPVDENHPYFSLSVEEFYRKYGYLFEFFEDNFGTLLPSRKDTGILDVGFGFAHFMVYAKMQGYTNIAGVEFTKTQVANAVSMGFKAEEISSLSDYLKSNSEQFDIIHLSHVVEHFPKYDLLELYDLLYSALKTNGKLIAVVPNVNGWRGLSDRYHVLGHETGFSETSFRQIFKVCNYKNICVVGSKIKFRPRIKNIVMIVLQKIINKVIGFIDYLYLGVNRPLHLSRYLIGVGYKKE